MVCRVWPNCSNISCDYVIFAFVIFLKNFEISSNTINESGIEFGGNQQLNGSGRAIFAGSVTCKLACNVKRLMPYDRQSKVLNTPSHRCRYSTTYETRSFGAFHMLNKLFLPNRQSLLTNNWRKKSSLNKQVITPKKE